MIDKKFKGDISFGFVAQGGVALAGLLFMLVVTRYGSIATYGALMLLTSVSGTMGNLLSFRTNEALVAFYKQGETKGDAGRCKFAIFAGVSLDLLAGLVLLVTILAASDLIAQALLKDGNAGANVQLFGLAMLAMVLKSSPLAFLQATERIKWVNALSLAESLAKLGIAGYVGISKQTLSLEEAVWALLIPAIGTVVIAYIPLATAIFTRFRSTVMARDNELIREYANFCMKTFASSTLKAGNQNIDTLILGLLTNTQTVGIYATLRQFLSPLSFLSGPFEAVAYPRFVKAIVQRKHNEVRQTIISVNSKLLLAFGAALFLILPVAAGYSFFMVITAVLRGQLWWARPFSNAVNPNLSLKANLVASLFMLIVLYPSTLAYGLTGTALTMFVLSIMLTFYWGRALARHV